MKIAITGPQGSGKTTLLRPLQTLIGRNLGIELDILPEVTRTVKEQGFPINEAGADETQLMILATHIQNVLARDNYIVDRCILDGYVYTAYLCMQGDVADYIAEFAYELLKRYFQSYDIVFYIPNEFPLADDGVRSVDESFRIHIERLFIETLARLKAAGLTSNVVELYGSVDARLEVALAAVDFFAGKKIADGKEK